MNISKLAEFCRNYPLPQEVEPVTQGHIASSKHLIQKWVAPLVQEGSVRQVLDVGCGTAYTKAMFERLGLTWIGIDIGANYAYCERNNIAHVLNWDMNFVPDYMSKQFDLVWARHVIEHSPFPLFTLREFTRLTLEYAIIVTPIPPHFEAHPGHVAVMSPVMWEELFRQAGFNIVERDNSDVLKMEMRWLLCVSF